MKILIKDENNNIIVDNTDDTCNVCIRKCDKSNIKINCPISNSEEKRMGRIKHKDKTIFLCSPKSITKTAKLFDEKLAMLVYSIPSIITAKNIAIHNERQKYERIVHNLKTLNAQSIQTQYKFLTQQKLSDHYEKLFDYVYEEIQNNPREATITLLRLIKNNAHMKTEFSTHEKLSMEEPVLSFQEHNIRSVILNVYHSFDVEFRDNHNSFRISDNNARVKIDYDTTRVAIYHLFSNAVKYMQYGTPMIVEIEVIGGQSVVDFKMKSLHINENELEKIYDDGYSGINTKTNNKNGKGLGMGLVRKALALNKAKLEVIAGDKVTTYRGDHYSENIFRIVFNS